MHPSIEVEYKALNSPWLVDWMKAIRQTPQSESQALAFLSPREVAIVHLLNEVAEAARKATVEAYEEAIARIGLSIDTTPDVELPQARDLMARVIHDMRIWPARYRELCSRLLDEEA